MRYHGLFAIVLMSMVMGCARDSGRLGITGTVALDGQPLETGSIMLVPIEGTQSPSAGALIEHGSFKISPGKGPTSGAFRVEIRSPRKTGKKVPAGSPAPPGTMVDETVESVPARFNRESKLRAELKPSGAPLQFELTSK